MDKDLEKVIQSLCNSLLKHFNSYYSFTASYHFAKWHIKCLAIIFPKPESASIQRAFNLFHSLRTPKWKKRKAEMYSQPFIIFPFLFVLYIRFNVSCLVVLLCHIFNFFVAQNMRVHWKLGMGVEKFVGFSRISISRLIS